jgi:hypothetical protein
MCRARKQALELRLSLTQRQASAIVSVQFQEIERIQEDAFIVGLRMKPIEDGEPVVVADYAFIIEQDRTDAELSNALHDTRKPVGPFCAAPRVDPHAIARSANR